MDDLMENLQNQLLRKGHRPQQKKNQPKNLELMKQEQDRTKKEKHRDKLKKKICIHWKPANMVLEAIGEDVHVAGEVQRIGEQDHINPEGREDEDGDMADGDIFAKDGVRCVAVGIHHPANGDGTRGNANTKVRSTLMHCLSTQDFNCLRCLCIECWGKKINQGSDGF